MVLKPTQILNVFTKSNNLRYETYLIKSNLFLWNFETI